MTDEVSFWTPMHNPKPNPETEVARLRAWLEWMERSEVCRHAHASIRRALDGEQPPDAR